MKFDDAVASPESLAPAEKAIQVDALTGLRGFAALAVVAVHASGRTDFDWFGIHGYGPVSLFVLSGFLLYRPWSMWALSRGTRPEVRTFARRRLLRIFPAYLVVMLAIAVMLPESQPLGPDGWLRVSIGTPEEMVAFRDALLTSLDRLADRPAGPTTSTTDQGVPA